MSNTFHISILDLSEFLASSYLAVTLPSLSPQRVVLVEDHEEIDPLDGEQYPVEVQRKTGPKSRPTVKSKRFKRKFMINRAQLKKQNTRQTKASSASSKAKTEVIETKRTNRNTKKTIVKKETSIVETEMGPFLMCPNEGCKRIFTKKDTLYRHIKYHCGVEPRFACGLCEYKAPRSHNVYKHFDHFRGHMTSGYLSVTPPSLKVRRLKALTSPDIDPLSLDTSFPLTKKGFEEVMTDEYFCSISTSSQKPSQRVSLDTFDVTDPLYFNTSQSRKEKVTRRRTAYIHTLTRTTNWNQQGRPGSQSSDSITKIRRPRRMMLGESDNIMAMGQQQGSYEMSSIESNDGVQSISRSPALDGRFYCANRPCKRSYTNYDAYYKHTKYECGKNPRFKCAYCNYKSYRAANVRVHSISIHPETDNLILDTYNNDRPYTIRKVYGTATSEYLPVLTQPTTLQWIDPSKTLVESDPLADGSFYPPQNIDAGIPPPPPYDWTGVSQMTHHDPLMNSACSIPQPSTSESFQESRIQDVEDDDIIEIEPEPSNIHVPKARATLKITTRIGNDGKVNYLCTNKGCKRSYTNRKAYYKHMKYECGKKPRFKCGYCPFKSLRAGAVRNHSFVKHPNDEIRVLDCYNHYRLYEPKHYHLGVAPPQHP
ncbi:hypothetical protein QAD02_022694 [Eretmocerus hayati]|uniref:Uncharacterized protein n=1 Tax=Eretmocerus hayati TaxID=131215 RepID=A0ACC2PU04_9HYME|nr:hypothetical protein QAD02_022694 [Eretmocerus hayati]